MNAVFELYYYLLDYSGLLSSYKQIVLCKFVFRDILKTKLFTQLPSTSQVNVYSGTFKQINI